MPIIYNEKTREFHLYNQEISYIIKILDNDQPGQLYYGKRLTYREDFSHLFEYAMRDMSPYAFEGNSTFSLENIKQEYPTFGCGDMRFPAYEIERENGSHVVEFVYKEHKIYNGKPKLEGLPATYVESDDEAQTLELVLEDTSINTRIVLLYTIYEAFPVIARSVRFECDSDEKITLLSAMSACVDLPDKDYEMIDLAGVWARERHVRRHKLDYGIQSIYSMRGCSSYQFNPFLALARENADEFQGQVYGFSLVYSGNFLAQTEVDNYDTARVLMGIHPNGFKWTLEKGESFQTPEMVMVYSEAGLNGMSQTFHKLYRTRLARGTWRDKVRPILINSWEAFYFDFDAPKLLGLADVAADLGMELFVLDDGWFGKRDDSTSSLGDWYPNEEKLKGTLKELAEKINAKGLKFGLWIEPEMTNKDSDLYRAHPDWILAEQGKRICHSRTQYVLDFSKKEVREYIGDMLENLLAEVPVSYIKWDMNRTFSEVFSNGNDREYQGKVCHKYILGVYELYERLTSRFPHVLFESCASGGARFDPGMLYYAPQGWTSDDTDAIERLKIQYGTSMVYPVSCMGSHVSASPNHQTNRVTPLETRADVAYFGTFGYELDLLKLGEEDKAEIRRQIAFMKEKRDLIQKGTFYRLKSPFEGNETAWMIVSEDQKKALVGYYRVMQPVNVGFKRLKLKGLKEDTCYKVSGYAYDCYGDELMQVGMILSDSASGVWKKGVNDKGDFQAEVFEIVAV
ncbi:alpha-galactosidase [Coprococcus comes]|uniref:alpha-galactosidase n=1 Tax=Coprococcus comes TaxID=410072 RepID=UPI00189C3854|nr:alpha-galactosidase [Coprococcus comes]